MKSLNEINDFTINCLRGMHSLLGEIYSWLQQNQMDQAMESYNRFEKEKNEFLKWEAEAIRLGRTESPPDEKKLYTEMYQISKDIEVLLNSQFEVLRQNMKQNEQLKGASRAYLSFEEGEQDSFFIDFKK